jgi:hypothetical protein
MSKKTIKLKKEMRNEEKFVNSKLDIRKTVTEKAYILTGVLGVINNKLNNADLREITLDYQGLLVNPTFLTPKMPNDTVKIISFMQDENAQEELSLNMNDTFDTTIMEALSKISILNKAMKKGTSEDIREIKEEVIAIITDLNDYMNDFLLTAQSELQRSKTFVFIAELEEKIKNLKGELKIAKKQKEDTTKIEEELSKTKDLLKGYGVSTFDKFERGLEKIANKIL